MLNLAAGLTDATAEGDAQSLAAIAGQLYGEADENLAQIGRLRAAIHAAWSRPRKGVTGTGSRLSGPPAWRLRHAGDRSKARRRRSHQPGMSPALKHGSAYPRVRPSGRPGLDVPRRE
jgi:hypothetical protein